jgi:tRNA(Ile)-lysidine synthase
MEARQKAKAGLDPLESRVQQSIGATELITPGSRILVGVSGGPDSMALLSVLCSLRPVLGLELIVLFCHHGLRTAADQEELFVRQWAGQWDCPFLAERLAVREFQQARKCSLQEAARECRYGALEAHREREEARAVALGHTADDQAEEVLIGLIRGAGLGGLAGIPRQRGPFIRPLLGIYREDILTYLKRSGIPWLEDASNRDRRYLRARIRHHLLPELEQYTPNMRVQLNRLAALLGDDEDFLQEITSQAWALTASGAREAPVLSRSRLAHFHSAIGSRLIQTALRGTPGGLAGLGSRHIRTLLRLASGPSPSGRFDLPGNRVAVWEKDQFMIRPPFPADRQPRPFSYLVKGPGKLLIRETGDILIFKKVRPEALAAYRWADGNKQEALMDWDKIRWPVRVRSLEAGDRFRPLGLGGSKKVARFLMDRKVSRMRRSQIPLLWSGDELAWVAGVEIAQSFALGPDSEAALHLEYRQGEKGIEISR